MKRSQQSSDSSSGKKNKTRSTTTTTTTTTTTMTPNTKRRMMKMEARTPILQRFWNKTRINSTNRIVKRFSAVGPTSTRIKRMSFEQVVIYLREKKVIAVSKACLQRIHLLTTFRHGSPSSALVPENVNIRVFLAGFMIAYYPDKVFETMGALEQPLFHSTLTLIEAFERICKQIAANPSFAHMPHELTKDFPTLLLKFLKAFKAWKVPDEIKLTKRIKHALTALYQALEHLPPDEPEDSPLMIEFNTTIPRLRSKLEQIAGISVLNAFDEERANGLMQIVNGVGNASAYMSKRTVRLSNQQLAHELLLDPLFQLEDDGCGTHTAENPIFHNINESFHRQFWDSLEDDLKLEYPCYVRVIRVLGQICDGIHDLCETSGIREVVDLEFISQQAQAGLYSWQSTEKLLAGILCVIERVQLAKRDSETRTKWEALLLEAANSQDASPHRALCNQLEFLLNRVNVMRIDAANARLRLISPTIILHGVDYERKQFQEKLDNSTFTLERTTAWLNRAITKPNDIVNGSTSAYIQVHMEAIRSLVTTTTKLTCENCPETLLLDVDHLTVLQANFNSQAMAATLLMTASTIVPPPQFATNKERLVEILTVENLNTKSLDEIILSIKDLLLLSDIRVEQLRESTQPTHHMYVIIYKRLIEYWSLDTVPPESTSALGKLFGFMSASIAKSVIKFKRIVKVNSDVYLPIYNRIIAEEARKKLLAP